MQRVVAVFGFKADFDVVLGASVTSKNLADLSAEVAFHFEDESADAAFRVVRPKGENLLGEWVHAAGGFSRADGADDGDARKQAPLRNRQPSRVFGRDLLSRVMDFSEDEVQLGAEPRVGIGRQFSGASLRTSLKRENIEAGKYDGEGNVGSGVKKQSIGVLQKEKWRRRPSRHDLEEEIRFGERRAQ